MNRCARESGRHLARSAQSPGRAQRHLRREKHFVKCNDKERYCTGETKSLPGPSNSEFQFPVAMPNGKPTMQDLGQCSDRCNNIVRQINASSVASPSRAPLVNLCAADTDNKLLSTNCCSAKQRKVSRRPRHICTYDIWREFSFVLHNESTELPSVWAIWWFQLLPDADLA